MKPLVQIAAASAAAAALCVAQALTASACDEHDPAASFTASVRSILPESNASPNPEWVPWVCTT